MNLDNELKAALDLEQDLIAKLAKTHGVIEFLMYALQKDAPKEGGV